RLSARVPHRDTIVPVNGLDTVSTHVIVALHGRRWCFNGLQCSACSWRKICAGCPEKAAAGNDLSYAPGGWPPLRTVQSTGKGALLNGRAESAHPFTTVCSFRTRVSASGVRDLGIIRLPPSSLPAVRHRSEDSGNHLEWDSTSGNLVYGSRQVQVRLGIPLDEFIEQRLQPLNGHRLPARRARRPR